MSANISFDGEVRQLDRASQPDENMGEQDVRDTSRLLRWMLNLFRRVRAVESRWSPNRIDFEGRVSTGTALAYDTIQLQHNFNGEVRWSVVDVQEPGTVESSLIYRVEATDPNVLTLRCHFPATLTIRVEQAG